jgi:SOS-response transcriptional repressor LexA
MKPIEVIRRENLKSLIPTKYRTVQALTDALEIKHRAQVSQWIHGSLDSKSGKARNISTSSARNIEFKLGLSVGWLDRPGSALGMAPEVSNRFPLVTWRAAANPDMASNEPPEDHRICHINLGEGGFALKVKDETMVAPGSSLFAPGTILYISRHYPVRHGSLVVARLDKKPEAIFRRYVELDGEPHLQALNTSIPNPIVKLGKKDTVIGVVVTSAVDHV